MKNKILKSVLIVAAATSMVSCDDYLDIDPTNSVSDKIIWNSKEHAQLQANYMYEDIAYIGTYGTGNGSSRECLIGLTEALTDAFKYGDYTYASLCQLPSEMAYGATSTLTSAYVDTYLGAWDNMYKYISTANVAIHSLRKFGSFEGMNEVEAEFRFFRAFYYSVLAKRYPKLILYTENVDEYQKDKAPVDVATVYQFIYDDLVYAGENLPKSVVPNGRITSGAAYALLSRVMLYAERWADAKMAAEKVMAMGYTMNYTNLDTPFTAGGEGAILQYCYDFKSITHSFDNYYAPGGDRTTQSNNVSGGYGAPTQEMVESYELATGGKPDWSEWHNSGENGTYATPPYANLEPRFHFTVLYNGASWKGRTIESYVGGMDGFATWFKDTKPDGKTVTGYYLRKLIDESHDFSVDQRSTKPWTAIRLAEVVLNYAEACYHTGDGQYGSALDAVNAIRTRAAVGLPALNVSGTAVMDAIRQERKVELAYEGLYYWDMRRWKLAESAFTGYRTHAMKIEKNPNGTFTYKYVECDDKDRNFPAKMYTCPIPQKEVDNNSLITQYPEWN